MHVILFYGIIFLIAYFVIKAAVRDGIVEARYIETPDEEDKIANIACPTCGKRHEMDYPKCPYCGHLYFELWAVAPAILMLCRSCRWLTLMLALALHFYHFQKSLSYFATQAVAGSYFFWPKKVSKKMRLREQGLRFTIDNEQWTMNNCGIASRWIL